MDDVVLNVNCWNHSHFTRKIQTCWRNRCLGQIWIMKNTIQILQKRSCRVWRSFNFQKRIILIQCRYPGGIFSFINTLLRMTFCCSPNLGRASSAQGTPASPRPDTWRSMTPISRCSRLQDISVAPGGLTLKSALTRMACRCLPACIKGWGEEGNWEMWHVMQWCGAMCVMCVP